MPKTRPTSILMFSAFCGLALWLAFSPRLAHAQSTSCDPIIKAFKAGISPQVCGSVAAGNACYVTAQVDSQLAAGGGPFDSPGRKVPIKSLKSITTRSPTGAALLVAGSATGDVKILAFGDAGLNSLTGQSFVVRKQGTGLLCEQTPPGVLLQTPSGKKGTFTVNGVKIDLGSTVFIATEGDLLFDQDPRIGRRQGRANPDAPLCSGFDSDCDFGDQSCALRSRVVWGPYCGEKRFKYVRPGLYRVGLYGAGRVSAGATDYELTRDQFSLTQHDFTLSPTEPAVYTFCWDGQQPGSTGWETVVTAQGKGARVDHMTVEFLGDDCATVGNAGSGAGAGVMTVTNIEGDVTVRALGEVMRPAPGEKVRIGLDGAEPVWIDAPRPAGAISGSGLVQWLTFEPGGLTDVTISDEPTYEPTDEPASEPTEEPVTDDGGSDASAPPTSPSEPGAGGTAGSNLITDFENFGKWRRGDQTWGTFTQSGEEVYGGNAAGKIEYDFPANAPGDSNYVVFQRSLPIPGRPAALRAQVYGDGSGNFLNAWVEDAAGQVWQFTFGQIKYTGWKPMVAALDTGAPWPVQVISGDGSSLQYPLQFQAFVLDYPTNDAASGVVYLDDLEAMTQGNVAPPSDTSPEPAAPPTDTSPEPAPPAEEPPAEEPPAEEPPAEEPPVDSQGPDIAYVYTDPAIEGDVFNTCPYNDFSVSAEVTDPSGVASATFYYRLTTFGTTSDWFDVGMDANGDSYYAALTGIDGDSIEFQVGAVDTLGNESYSNVRSATIALCDGGSSDDGSSPSVDADSQGPDISNVSTAPAIEGDTLNICPEHNFSVFAVITDPSGVASATFAYRLSANFSQSDWITDDMVASGDSYYATLTGIDAEGIELMIIAADTLGNETEFDAGSATIAPCGSSAPPGDSGPIVK